MKKTETTSEQKAMSRLRRAMKLSREVTPGQVDKYLQDNLQERVSITSDDLPITTIHDFCLFIVVTRLALSSQIRGPQGRTGHPMQVALRHFRFDRIQGELTDNPYLQVPKFIVTKQKTESQHAA